MTAGQVMLDIARLLSSDHARTEVAFDQRPELVVDVGGSYRIVTGVRVESEASDYAGAIVIDTDSD
jgi:hypothetical protein